MSFFAQALGRAIAWGIYRGVSHFSGKAFNKAKSVIDGTPNLEGVDFTGLSIEDLSAIAVHVKEKKLSKEEVETYVARYKEERGIKA